MNIVDVLKHEHQSLKLTVEALQKGFAHPKRKKVFFKGLSKELMAYTQAKQKTIYKQLKAAEEVRSDILASAEEAMLVESLRWQMEDEELSEEEWDAKGRTLCKVLLHHLESEEKDTLPLARRVLDTASLEALGQAFEEEKIRFIACH